MKRFALALAAAVVALPQVARAEDSPHTWWVDAHPWTCSRWIPPLARQIQLACDALGHSCFVASTEAEADRRADLRCDGDTWQLEALTGHGARLWSVELAGDPEDRLRKAAVWAATAGGDVPGPPPAPAPSPRPRADAPISPVRAVDSTPTAPPSAGPAAPGRGGVSLAARGMAGDGKTSTHDATLAGGRIAAGFRPFDPSGGLAPLSIGAAVYGGHTVSSDRDVFLGTAGLTLGWGAPWTDDVFGVAIEGGAALLDTAAYVWGPVVSADPAVYSIDPGISGGTRARQVLPYASASVLAAAHTGALRPFAAATVQHISSHALGPITTGAIDLGLAWNAF
jgi:hypothetical protein